MLGDFISWYPEDSPPKNPKEGDAYFDSCRSIVKIYSNKKWNIFSSPKSLNDINDIQEQTLIYPCEHGSVTVQFDDFLPEEPISNVILSTIEILCEVCGEVHFVTIVSAYDQLPFCSFHK